MNKTNDTSRSLPCPHPAKPTAYRFDRHDAIWLMLLVTLTVVVLGKDISKGGVRSMDSPVHAMDGVLVHDWVAAGPSVWADPMGFAIEQYAHYPSLSIGRHYPPGFAIVEAAFYGVFGISAVSARMAVVFMGILGVVGTYVFMRRFAGGALSVLAGATWLTMPAVTLWGHQTMLELPTLSVMIWAAVALTHYLAKPSGGRFALVISITLLSLFFKQNALFLIGAVAAAVGVCAWRGDAPWHHFVLAMVLCVLVPLVVWLSMSQAVAKLVAEQHGIGTETSLGTLTLYARLLPGEVGLWVLVAAAIGFVVLWRRSPVYATFLTVWVAGCYAMVTLAGFKSARFFFVGLFPFAIWAALGCGCFMDRLSSRWRSVTVVLGIVMMSVLAFDQPIDYYPDQGPVVIAHRREIEGHAVLFSGLRDGDFVFAVRQHIPWRKTIVIRASKLLYTCLAYPIFDFKSNVAKLRDVEAAIRPLGLAHLFIERENRLNVHADQLLREYLTTTDTYHRIDSVRLAEEREPNYRNVTMDVYESATPLQRTVEFLDIPLPRINRTIRVSLSDWSG